MSDHTEFRDTQEERAEHQMIEQSRRMRKKAEIGRDALQRIKNLTGPWQSIAEGARAIADEALSEIRRVDS